MDTDVDSHEEDPRPEEDNQSVSPPPPEDDDDAEASSVSTPARPQRRPDYDDDAVMRTPEPAAAAVPPTPTSQQEEEEDDSMIVPATPLPQTNNTTPFTPPLTPLSDLVGNDNEDQQDQDETMAPPDDDDDDQDHNVMMETLIRGTDVHVPTAAATFSQFLRAFVSLQHSQRQNKADDDSSSSDSSSSDEDEEDEQPPLYLSKLQQLVQHGAILPGSSSTPATTTNSLDIDTMHLYYHTPASQRFYHQLVSYPMEMVPLMDLVVKRELKRLLLPEFQRLQEYEGGIPQIQVRPFNLRHVSNLRCLDPTSLDSLLCIKGMVVRTSTIIPDLKVAHFDCTICGYSKKVTIDRGCINEPTVCDQCTCRKSFTLVHNRSVFADKQLVRMQETPDEVPSGQTPASTSCFCFDDLVDSVKPGDRVELTGVLRAQPRRVNPKISKLKSVYKTYIDVIHFRRINGMDRRKQQEQQQDGGNPNRSSLDSGTNTTHVWTKERVEELYQLSKSPDIYQQLTQSLAPSIWELDNVKKGVLCMLLGGNQIRVKHGSVEKNKNRMDDDDDDSVEIDSQDDEEDQAEAVRLNKRGDVNILLCGDPGTSKSQLLSYVHKLSARGVYTSGKGSSAVGLTASVVRDPETRDLVLESGALVLSDLGICCIDEFDKMSDGTRSVLHEAMEQQTVSIAKAGIIATLHARTSILASANPTESRYNPSMSVVENIQLPPTLLSRFDLIYLILDSPNVDHDRRLAQHLVGLYYETPNVVKPPLDQELLRDYIEYARQHIHPELSDDASEELISSYLQMRSTGSGGNGNNGRRTISATPRQLESLIRLSEALAKMRYGQMVTRADAREAVRLMRVATQAAATDPRTGRIDMDMITTGRSTAEREMEETMNLHLKELLAERRGNRMAVRDVTRQLSEITNTTVSQDEVVEALRRMEADGVIQFNERAQTVFVRAGVVS